MRWNDFIKEKGLLIILFIITMIMEEILLIPYGIAMWIRYCIFLLPLIGVIIALGIEFYQKRNFYQMVYRNLEDLEEKYLISEIIGTPNFIEGKILKDVVEETGKSMLEHVNEYKHLQEDYKEYIELWIHEVKLPISSSKMMIENNKTKITKSIEEEIDKIDCYTEQALFYARSNTVEKDYLIAKSNLQEIVNSAILKNKHMLMNQHVSLNLHDLEKQVYTDSKWAIFIINQILQNAAKYARQENKEIEIYAKEEKERVILCIKDNGIGISQKEILRVFEKGFTGENGRIIGKKSTGIGLYLSKKLCDKLQLGIELNSQKDIGTEVKIVFPKGSYVNDVHSEQNMKYIEKVVTDINSGKAKLEEHELIEDE